MTPSEELLAIREKCAAEWGPGEWFRDEYRGTMSYEAWCFIQRFTFWPFGWLCGADRTHLEVVELIERAAVCALRDEGRL